MDFFCNSREFGELDFATPVKVGLRHADYLAGHGLSRQLCLDELARLNYETLTRLEEADCGLHDRRGRFPFDQSDLARSNLSGKPVIDQVLVDALKDMNFQPAARWPDGRKAAVCLTHDVDLFDGTSFKVLRQASWWFKLALFCMRGKVQHYRDTHERITRWRALDYDPVYAFDQWMELEDEHGVRSTFFFLALDRALSLEGRRYSYKDPRVRTVIRRLHENGWEVGLHAAYYGHLNSEYLIRQKHNLENILGSEVQGCRHHYLRVVFPRSWELYAKAGFRYSSNMGWSGGNNGFRAGTCIPYPVPLLDDRLGQLWEVPFQLMDSPRIDQPSRYVEQFEEFMRRVKQVGGCLVLDFHQEYLDPVENPGVQQTYREILKRITEDDEVWVAPIGEVVQHLETIIR